jgi:hypothetical protein
MGRMLGIRGGSNRADGQNRVRANGCTDILILVYRLFNFPKNETVNNAS